MKPETVTFSECPACCGPGVLLGALGNTTHFRCRDCGWMYHKTVKPKKRKPSKAVA